MGKPTRICSIDGCEGSHLARGWCGRHYQKWKVHGDPLGGGNRYSSPDQSFAARTAWRGSCLEWRGVKCSGGYGLLRVGGKMTPAHRFAWEQAHGPIPTQTDVDHICHNPACCNVEHLRLATRLQNARHRAGATVASISGVRNVHRHGNRWRVRLFKDGAHLYFGSYATIAEAAAVAERERARLFGEFAGEG